MAKSADDPCWKNYEQVGMKEKNGKEVPNCVPSGKAASAKKKAKTYQSSKGQ